MKHHFDYPENEKKEKFKSIFKTRKICSCQSDTLTNANEYIFIKKKQTLLKYSHDYQQKNKIMFDLDVLFHPLMDNNSALEM